MSFSNILYDCNDHSAEMYLYSTKVSESVSISAFFHSLDPREQNYKSFFKFYRIRQKYFVILTYVTLFVVFDEYEFRLLLQAVEVLRFSLSLF